MGIQALIDTQVLTVTGSTGDVMTVQADGSYLAEAPAGGGVGGSSGAVDNAVLRADGTGGATLQTSAFTIADLATASPNNTVNNVSMAATGGTTNVSVSIVPKGTGSFSLQVPDGTTAGGNARGAYAVDLQTVRSAAAEVASGYGSIVAGNQCKAPGSRAVAIGLFNTASGDFSFAANYASTASGTGSTAFGGSSCAGAQSITVGNLTTAAGAQSIGVGYQCFASGNQSQAFGYISAAAGQYSMAHGLGAGSNRLAMYSHSAGSFVANGDAQSARFVLRIKTTDATATPLMLDGATTRLTIPSGKIMFADILISGILSTGASACCYKRKVAIKNVGGTTTLVGTVETIGTDIEDNAACDVAITADDTNDALDISVTGIAAETWRWVAVVEGLEIAYGT